MSQNATIIFQGLDMGKQSIMDQNVDIIRSLKKSTWYAFPSMALGVIGCAATLWYGMPILDKNSKTMSERVHLVEQRIENQQANADDAAALNNIMNRTKKNILLVGAGVGGAALIFMMGASAFTKRQELDVVEYVRTGNQDNVLYNSTYKKVAASGMKPG